MAQSRWQRKTISHVGIVEKGRVDNEGTCAFRFMVEFPGLSQCTTAHERKSSVFLEI